MFGYKMFMSWAYLLFCLMLGNSKENEAQCPHGSNASCNSKSVNIFQTLWNKSMEVFRFNIKLISVTKCKLPASKMDPSHPITANHTLRRVTRETTMLDVEVRAAKRVGPLSMSSRCYQIKQNSAKDLIYKIEKAECNSYLMAQTQLTLQLKFENCHLEQGVQKASNLNLEVLTGYLSKTITAAGIYSYEVEVSHPRGIIYCYTFNCQVMEKRKSRN